MTNQHPEPTLVLIPGYWLGAWAWDEVAEHLAATGRRVIALTLPGLDAQDPQRTSRTLDDQAAAIEHALRQESDTGRRCIVVAHSGANAPVSLVLDRHPELVEHVVWVDSGPATSAAEDTAGDRAEVPLPSFGALAEQASLDGLDPAMLDRFRSRAVPEPGLVANQPVVLRNDRRFAVPTTLVCCSIPSQQLLQLAKAGHPMFAEVARLQQVALLDLPTGHWPMWSRPADLAELLATITTPSRA
nr:alpha/beta fold hydrolase [Propionicimonas sp.]